MSTTLDLLIVVCQHPHSFCAAIHEEGPMRLRWDIPGRRAHLLGRIVLNLC